MILDSFSKLDILTHSGSGINDSFVRSHDLPRILLF